MSNCATKKVGLIFLLCEIQFVFKQVSILMKLLQVFLDNNIVSINTLITEI